MSRPTVEEVERELHKYARRYHDSRESGWSTLYQQNVKESHALLLDMFRRAIGETK